MIHFPSRNYSFDNFHFEGMSIRNLRNEVLYPSFESSILLLRKKHLFVIGFAFLFLQASGQMQLC